MEVVSQQLAYKLNQSRLVDQMVKSSCFLITVLFSRFVLFLCCRQILSSLFLSLVNIMLPVYRGKKIN